VLNDFAIARQEFLNRKSREEGGGKEEEKWRRF